MTITGIILTVVVVLWLSATWLAMLLLRCHMHELERTLTDLLMSDRRRETRSGDEYSRWN